MVEQREYEVAFTVVTDITTRAEVERVLRTALDLVPLSPYFDYVNVQVAAVEVHNEACCSSGECNCGRGEE